MPYFFLSYASADDDGYLERFYADLCEAVRSRTGHGADDIGFRDQSNIEVGVDWSSSLVEALTTTPVFVAACSPSYFASELCGKEWQVFADQAVHQVGTERAYTGLLPIIWIPTATLPEVARRLQYSHESLGDMYRREGLHFLSRLSRHRDDYHTFVIRLAERIVTVSETYAPSASRAHVDLQSVRSAFEFDAPAPTSTPAGQIPHMPPDPQTTDRAVVPGGPRHVTFVVVAAPAHELARIGRDLQFYGPTPEDWAPYRPRHPQRICVFSQSIASTKDLTSALETVERSIGDLLDRARERNEIVVLLVDVWATALESYQAFLLDYDDRNAPTSAVLVPWNEADAETAANTDMLRDALSRAFPNNSARRDTVFRPAIRTIEGFRTALEEVLAEAQSRIFRFGTVARRAGGDRAIQRPILTHPGQAGIR